MINCSRCISFPRRVLKAITFDVAHRAVFQKFRRQKDMWISCFFSNTGWYQVRVSTIFGINMYYQKHITSSFMFNTTKKHRLRQSGLLCITKLPVPMYGTCEGRVAETDNTYGNWSSAWYSHCKNIGLIQCCCLTIPSNYSYYCYKLNSQPKLPSGYLT